MTLEKDVDLSSVSSSMEDFSGAEIKAVCTEAGYFAIRNNRSKIIESDFLEAIIKVNRREQEEGKDYMNLFHQNYQILLI